MEYFMKTKYVRLKSLHNKYLIAGKDGVSVKQCRKGNAIRACWGVEIVNDRPNLICLRSCHGKLLTASNEPFLMGLTGKKVVQTSGNGNDPSVQWEPVPESDHPFFITLRTPLYNKFLRANGGAPPWRKSVTVDVQSVVTQMWVMWRIDALEYQGANIEQCLWPRSSDSEEFYSSSSLEIDQSVSFAGSSSPTSSVSPAFIQKGGLLDLHNAKTIRLRSHHDKYLLAHEDGKSVTQDKHGSSKRAYWTVEHISSVKGGNLVCLKSSYQKYLTATDDNFLLGATGKKVTQTVPERLDYSIEWELVRDGKKVKLKTWDGNYLRANGGVPPWRNSVTHDLPSLSPNRGSIHWEIEVFDVYED